MFNNFSANGTAQQYRLHTIFNNAGYNVQYDVYNEISGTGSGTKAGARTDISNSGAGQYYGDYTTISGTGNGFKYGAYTRTETTAGGSLYGVYSEVLRPTGTAYAGCFLGRVSIGTTGANTYRLPSSRGLNEQVMQTDTNGNINWVNTNSLNTNNWSLTGNAGTNATTNFIGTTDNIPLVFRSNNIEEVRIDTNGDVLINNPATTNNSALLKNDNFYNHSSDNNLNFGTGGNYFMLSSSESSGETRGVRGDGNNLAVWSPADGGRLIRFLDEDFWDNDGNPYDNEAERAYIEAAGQYFQVSDREKKENIQQIEKTTALSKITSLKGYTYSFKQAVEDKIKGMSQSIQQGLWPKNLRLLFPKAYRILMERITG
jgi:hypothetical protein